MKQTEMVREALEAGRKITAAMAWREMGVMRLAARVKNLRDKGMPIRTELVTMRTRSGKARVGRYFI